MRVIRGLSFYAGGELLAADVAYVQNIARNLEITPVPTAPRAVAGITNLKGKVVTLLCAPALLKAGAPVRIYKQAAAIVFKPFSGEDDQMGLIIERPGDLIEIEEADIVPPPLAGGAQAAPYISGVAEVCGALYRVLDAKAIVDSFRNSGEPQGGIIYEKPL